MFTLLYASALHLPTLNPLDPIFPLKDVQTCHIFLSSPQNNICSVINEDVFPFILLQVPQSALPHFPYSWRSII